MRLGHRSSCPTSMENGQGGGRYIRQMTTSDRRMGKNEVGLVRAALVRISGRTNEPTGEAMPPP